VHFQSVRKRTLTVLALSRELQPCANAQSGFGASKDGRKIAAGTIEAADPRELVMKWSLFLATAERGVYFATYRGSFVAPEAALESDAGALAA